VRCSLREESPELAASCRTPHRPTPPGRSRRKRRSFQGERERRKYAAWCGGSFPEGPGESAVRAVGKTTKARCSRPGRDLRARPCARSMPARDMRQSPRAVSNRKTSRAPGREGTVGSGGMPFRHGGWAPRSPYRRKIGTPTHERTASSGPLPYRVDPIRYRSSGAFWCKPELRFSRGDHRAID